VQVITNRIRTENRNRIRTGNRNRKRKIDGKTQKKG
jgi:hypothetical protein